VTSFPVIFCIAGEEFQRGGGSGIIRRFYINPLLYPKTGQNPLIRTPVKANEKTLNFKLTGCGMV
tara:strand:- start:451 stop:645 length:195 start_codon:yes stop_codon:yes gene_type:complete